MHYFLNSGVLDAPPPRFGQPSRFRVTENKVSCSSTIPVVRALGTSLEPDPIVPWVQSAGANELKIVVPWAEIAHGTGRDGPASHIKHREFRGAASGKENETRNTDETGIRAMLECKVERRDIGRHRFGGSRRGAHAPSNTIVIVCAR